MSTIDNDSLKKTEKDGFACSAELDNDEKSIFEAHTSENTNHEVIPKKRKLPNQKMKSLKKSKSQNSASGHDNDTLMKDNDGNELVSRKHSMSHSLNRDVHDIYCWMCYKTDNTVECSFCPRAFHPNCVQSCFCQPESDSDDWICPECISLMVSECTLNIVPKWKTISTQKLNEMLLFVLLRLYHINGSVHFHVPVDDQTIKDYYTIIKYPVSMDLLKERVLNNEYTSVYAFQFDFKWILHNCTVYNGAVSVLTTYAKNMDKVCSKEISLMRSCPECFMQRMPFMIKLLKDQGKNSPIKSTVVDKTWDFSIEDNQVTDLWMTKLCNSIHCLVWVRLHNYPVWPGKLISLDDESALVLFFGDYDLNIVPLGSICIHTQSNHKRLIANITNFANRRTSAPTPLANSVSKEYQLALEQLNVHLDNIKKKYDYFVIPPKKLEFNIQAGVEYYEKMRLQLGQPNDVIVVDSFEDAGLVDDNSDLTVSEKNEFRLEQDKSEKMEENSSAVSVASFYRHSKIRSQQSSSSSLPFIKSFESGVQSLLNQFKIDCMGHFKVAKSDETLEDWTSLSNPLESTSQFHDFRQQTDPIAVCNAGVQFSSQEFVKEEELRNYIRYLEKSLATAEIEIRRLEILTAVHHEESMLEFAKQQKELKKVYDQDVMEITKALRNKFDEKFGRAVQKVKLNEWCAFCSKLARFYCCWNTCYCNQECQSKHWEMHKATCTQINRSPAAPAAVAAAATATTTVAAAMAASCVSTTPSVIRPKSPYPPTSSNTGIGSAANSIPSMMHHMMARNNNGDMGVAAGTAAINGSNLSEFVSNVPQQHKQRLPLKR